mmetsp:Transcript_95635/g.270642  ORF Transcript_95635/g.270642 Transcript_95635/m.270642 type:complete len:235 (+) Transcript_95635:1004-1708(+)
MHGVVNVVVVLDEVPDVSQYDFDPAEIAEAERTLNENAAMRHPRAVHDGHEDEGGVGDVLGAFVPADHSGVVPPHGLDPSIDLVVGGLHPIPLSERLRHVEYEAAEQVCENVPDEERKDEPADTGNRQQLLHVDSDVLQAKEHRDHEPKRFDHLCNRGLLRVPPGSVWRAVTKVAQVTDERWPGPRQRQARVEDAGTEPKRTQRVIQHLREPNARRDQCHFRLRVPRPEDNCQA